jgi:hypothetical protein
MDEKGKEVVINMSQEKITTSRGEVVGIGKVKMPKTQDFKYEIQMLSFLVIKESEDSYISTCIHLHIDGYGKSVEESYYDMFESIFYFLYKNFEKLPVEKAWENLEELFLSDEWSCELWNAYHKVQIQLSMKGISTDNTEQLFKRIKQLEARVKRLKSEEARKLEEEIMRFSKDLIDYTPVSKSAA